MATIQDKVNERHELSPEEFEELKAFDIADAAMRKQQEDFAEAMQALYAKSISARRAWWNRARDKYSLDVKELVYSVEVDENDPSKATLIVVDLLPQQRADAVQKKALKEVTVDVVDATPDEDPPETSRILRPV